MALRRERENKTVSAAALGAGSRELSSAFSFISTPSADALPLSCRRGWFPFSYTRVLDNDGSERVHAR